MRLRSPRTSGCRGLQFQVSYNHAKNLSNGGGYAPGGFASESGGTLSDPSNPNLDYGNVAYTRRDRFQTTFLYALPFGHTGNMLVNQLAGGWELAGVLLFQSGPFLTVVASGADPSGTNFPNLQGSGRVDSVPGDGVLSGPAKSRPMAECRGVCRAGEQHRPLRHGAGWRSDWARYAGGIAVLVPQHQLYRALASAGGNFGGQRLESSELWPSGPDAERSSFGTVTSLQSAEGAGPRQVQLTGRITF